MKILITGVAGRIGRAIHAGLAPAHGLLGVDRRPSPLTDIVGEIDDAALLQRALRGVDAIIHVAALHAPHVGVLPDSEFERINVAATRQLIVLAREAGVRRVLYTSTTALYGRASTPPGRAVPRVPSGTAFSAAVPVLLPERKAPRPGSISTWGGVATCDRRSRAKLSTP